MEYGSSETFPLLTVTLSEAKGLGNFNTRFFATLRMTITVRLFATNNFVNVMNNYFVYILANNSKMLYTGVTNNLVRRVYEHKHHLVKGYTQKYNITKLVYFEDTNDVTSAIAREKQIKGWLRRKKVALIESANPQWTDLSENELEG